MSITTLIMINSQWFWSSHAWRDIRKPNVLSKQALICFVKDLPSHSNAFTKFIVFLWSHVMADVSAYELTWPLAPLCCKHSPILMNLQGNICSSILCFSVNVSLLKSFLRPLGLDQKHSKWPHYITRSQSPTNSPCETKHNLKAREDVWQQNKYH